jgi:antitoxin (DNA-binding transcriptional repressor) of toxin-antitoxin stability system
MKKKEAELKTASVRDLRYHFSGVEHLLRDGEEIQITKHKRVIARLVPVRPQLVVLHHRPDFLKRLKKIYGNRILKPSGAELLAQDRDRY